MTTDIGAQIDAHIDEAEIIELMRRLHRHQSFPPYEASAMAELQSWLAERGINADLIDVADEPGRPNLYYKMEGTGGGKTVMYNGHMDIDPVPMYFEGDPWEFKIEDGMIYAHGLINMKAGVAAAAAAFIAIHRAGIPLRGDLLMTAVVGELQGGVGAVDLVQRGLLGDVCIIPEPTGMELLPLHAGAIQFLVNTIGEAAWIGAMHNMSYVNAAEKLARIITALEGFEFDSPRREEFPRPAAPHRRRHQRRHRPPIRPLARILRPGLRERHPGSPPASPVRTTTTSSVRLRTSSGASPMAILTSNGRSSGPRPPTAPNGRA